MRYYIDSQGPLKFFKTKECKDVLDLEYIRTKASKIYLNIINAGWNNTNLVYLEIELIIPNEEIIIAFLSPILFNIILIEDYDFKLLDGRFNY